MFEVLVRRLRYVVKSVLGYWKNSEQRREIPRGAVESDQVIRLQLVRFDTSLVGQTLDVRDLDGQPSPTSLNASGFHAPDHRSRA